MGNSGSRIIAFEDAVARWNLGFKDEMQRLKKTYEKTNGPRGLKGPMSKQMFIQEVLGETLPRQLCERIFSAFTYSNKHAPTLTFKEFLCGMVIMLHGTADERINFLFNMFDIDHRGYLTREAMEVVIASSDGEEKARKMSEETFTPGVDRVTREDFPNWARRNREAFTLTQWAFDVHRVPFNMADNGVSTDESQDVYATFAALTNFDETEVRVLSTNFSLLRQRAAGASESIDSQTLQALLCPPLPSGLSDRLFKAFDDNNDGTIGFRELIYGLSVCCRGSPDAKYKFVFSLFDDDRNGFLSRDELYNMIQLVWRIDTHDDGIAVAEAAPEEDDDVKSPTVSPYGRSPPRTPAFATPTAVDANTEGTLAGGDAASSAGKASAEIPIGSDKGKGKAKLSIITEDGAPVAAPLGSVDLDHLAFSPVANFLKRSDRTYSVSDAKGDIQSSLQEEPGADVPQLKRWPSDSLIRNPDSTQQLVDQALEGCEPEGMSQLRFMEWVNHHPNTLQFLEIVNKITSLSLGLRPMSHMLEREYIHECVRGERRRGRRAGDVLFVLSKVWWDAWKAYVGFDEVAPVEEGRQPQPGTIDNRSLVDPQALYGEVLRPGLEEGRDYVLFSERTCNALYSWYRADITPSRTVVAVGREKTLQCDLYPLNLKLVKKFPSKDDVKKKMPMPYGQHVSISKHSTVGALIKQICKDRARRWFAWGTPTQAPPPDHNPSKCRLWVLGDMITLKPRLLTRRETLLEAQVEDGSMLLLDVQTETGEWEFEQTLEPTAESVPQNVDPGLTGLNNLGNTCFMNSAIQCLSNTAPLTEYIMSDQYLAEINTTNPLGYKGLIAKRYGELIKMLWAGNAACVAPTKFRSTVAKTNARFNNNQQQDSQEFLAFLLDGLHEDMNRIVDKPYVEIPDSNGRPDAEVALEGWEGHLRRNSSIIVDLFTGQLKSTLTCVECGYTSVRFDAFTSLSLPLPVETIVYTDVILYPRDGSQVPVKYDIALEEDKCIGDLRIALAKLAGLPPQAVVLANVSANAITSFCEDRTSLKLVRMSTCAYEVLPPPGVDPFVAALERAGSPGGAGASGERRDAPGRFPASKAPPGDSAPAPGPAPADEGASAPAAADDRGKAPADAPADPPPRTVVPSITATRPDSPLVIPHPRGSSLPHAPIRIHCMHRRLERRQQFFINPFRSKLFGQPMLLSFDLEARPMSNRDLYRYIWESSRRIFQLQTPPKLARPRRSGSRAGSAYASMEDSMTSFSASNTSRSRTPGPRRPRRSATPTPAGAPPKPSHARTPSAGSSLMIGSSDGGEEDSFAVVEPEFPFHLRVVNLSGTACGRCEWNKFCMGCTIPCDDSALAARPHEHLAVDWDATLYEMYYSWREQNRVTEHPSVQENMAARSKPVSLDECLGWFTKEERLDKDEPWHCSRCQKLVEATKKIDIWKIPAVLIVHLKRFSLYRGRWIKSQKLVEFPCADFDPSRYVANAETQGRFDLFAITNHYGSLGGGHYVAMARNKSGSQWFCYNDSSCEPVDESGLLTPAAYVLFFARRGDQARPAREGGRREAVEVASDDEAEPADREKCVIL